MLPVIVLAAMVGGALAAGLAVTFRDEIRAFLRSSLERIQALFPGLVRGFRLMLKRAGRGLLDTIHAVATYYLKEPSGWQQSVYRQAISQDQVPREIVERLDRLEEVELDQDLLLL